MMPLKLLVTLSLIMASSGGQDIKHVSCQSHDFKHTVKFWQEKYDMRSGFNDITKPFVIKTLYLPNRTIPDSPIGGVEQMFGNKVAYPFQQLVSLYETAQLQPFRQTNFLWNFHFLHGDSAVIHILHPDSGEYEKVELGTHSLKYSIFIKKGTYFSVDISDHTDDKYILLGIVPVRGNITISQFDFVPQTKLLSEFPQHAQTINDLYRRASVLPQFTK